MFANEIRRKISYFGILSILSSGIFMSGYANAQNVAPLKVASSTTATQNNNDHIVYLVGPNDSSAAFLYKPSLTSRILCVPFINSQARILEEKNYNGITWEKVDVMNGNCQGLQGWVSANNVKLS